MRLIVGLGNPGARYAGNRHNIGFLALDEIARVHRAGPWRRKFQGEVTEAVLGTERVVLLKPQTFMNESGRSVSEAQRFYKIALSDVIVLHDELDLAPALRLDRGDGRNADRPLERGRRTRRYGVASGRCRAASCPATIPDTSCPAPPSIRR